MLGLCKQYVKDDTPRELTKILHLLNVFYLIHRYVLRRKYSVFIDDRKEIYDGKGLASH